MSGLNQGPALTGIDSSGRKDAVGNFRLTAKTALDYADIKISKWRSAETGLRVVHVDYESPILEGGFAIATEISDDDGCAHSLEHLVFHGSETHPYTDSLYSIASRYFTATLNAHTRQDCTIYSMKTAGEYSFLKMLPVYVEHILYPRLVENDFITEVFHVDHEGHDAGVVYSEVQGRGVTSTLVTEEAFKKALFPPRNGYRGNISGSMEKLRTLDLATIKTYHSSYYQPQNLCLIVAGRLSTSKLLEEVQNAIEPQLISRPNKGDIKGKRLSEDWKRPFFDTQGSCIPTLEKDKSVDVEYPSQESKFGGIRMIFPHSPRPEATVEMALQILGEYLTGDSGAPLRTKFMTTPSLYCTSINVGLITKANLLENHIVMDDVPVKDLEVIEVKMRKAFVRIAKKGFDMKRMTAVINSHELTFKVNMEEQIGLIAVESFVEDFLYGDGTETQLKEQCDVLNIYASIRTWKSEKWVQVLTEYFINTKMLVVRARPSPTLSSQLEADERRRVAERITRLGKVGLEKQKAIVEATQNNKDLIPNETLAAISLPDTKSISWINVQSVSTKAGSEALGVVEVNSHGLAAHIRAERCTLPFSLHFDQVSSSFIYLNVYISLANLPHELRPVIYLYHHWFFSHPIVLENKTRLSVEEMRLQLDQDIVFKGFGSSDHFPDHLQFSLKVEPSKYAKGVRWLYLLLFSKKFSRDWLQSGLAGLKQSVPRSFRDPSGVLNDVYFQEMHDDTYSFKSYLSSETIKRIPILESMLKRHPKDVMQKLKQFEDVVLNQTALRFSVIGNILVIPKPRAPWAEYFGKLKVHPEAPLRFNSASLSSLGQSPRRKAIVVSLANVHTSCSTHVTTGITGWDHPLEPALTIAADVLHGPERYFYKRIRGAGLAYGANVYLDTSRGHITFGIYKSPNAAKAYTEAKAVVQGLVDGNIPLDDRKIEAAKNYHTFALVKGCSVPFDMANTVFINRTLKNRSKTWNQDRLSAIHAVTKEQVLAVMKSHLLPLFQPETSVTLVVCGPAQTDEIVAGFKREGFDVELRELDDRMPWDLEEAAKGKKKEKGRSAEKDKAKTKAKTETEEKEKDTNTSSGTLGRLKNLSIGRGNNGHSIFPFRKETKHEPLQEALSS